MSSGKKDVKSGASDSAASRSETQYKLPSPENLAVLAALIGPRDSPRPALEKALRLYLHAQDFAKEVGCLSGTELLYRYGPDETVKASILNMGLRFYFGQDEKDADEFRNWLHKDGIPYAPKKSESVLGILRDFFRARGERRGVSREASDQEFDDWRTRQERTDETGLTYILVDPFTASDVLAWKKFLKAAGARRGHEKRRLGNRSK